MNRETGLATGFALTVVGVAVFATDAVGDASTLGAVLLAAAGVLVIGGVVVNEG